eukprot:1318388-Amphidinium_carterae.1
MDDFASGELPESHIAFLSAGSRSVGGILVLIKKSAVNGMDAQWMSVVGGQSWEYLLQVATKGVTDEGASVTFLVGDTNVAHEVGPRALRWKASTRGMFEVHAGLTH